jgi:hypothetical protein
MTALAASNCAGQWSFEYDGYNDSIATWGASAWINTRPATFCSTNNGQNPDPLGNGDFITAWSQVLNNPQTRYAQAGYFMYRNYSNFQFFSEYSDVNCARGFCRTILTTKTYNGDNNQYYEAYNSGMHRVEMWVGSTRIDYTGYDPTDPNAGGGYDYWQGPWVEHFNGETLNPANDLPGLVTQKAS